MSKTILRHCVLLLALCFCSCGKEEPASKTEPNDSQTVEKAAPSAPPTKAPLIGEPTGSGYTPESIRVQIGPDESLREQHSPKEGTEFLLVRFAVNAPAELVPKDYRIVIDNKQYTPHAIGFGRPSGVYSSAETFVGDKVALRRGSSDRILHDGERIEQSVLNNPIVFLVYEVPKTSTPTLWHGGQSFALHPDYQALAGDLSGDGGTLTAKTQIHLADPNATSETFFAQLMKTTRTRIELNGTPADVVAFTIGLSTLKPATIELDKSEIRLAGTGGSSKAGTIYFHFEPESATLTAGSSYTEGETYEGHDLIGLDSGSFRVPLAPENSITMTMIFPDPKLQGDLELTLSSEVAVRVPELVNPLGKFPPPVERMPAMVAWSPLVGSPIDAAYLPGQASIAPNAKQISSPASQAPKDGMRFLMVKFRVEQASQLVPIDYRIAEQESNTVYRPVAVAFGESPTYVKDLDYEKIPLTFGSATAPKHQGNKLTGWTLKTREVTLLYEVTPAPEFVFLHGDTQFVIEL